MSEICTRTITCSAGMPTFAAVPDTDAKVPVVIVMHERYGFVRHTRDLAERFARDGLVAIAPPLLPAFRPGGAA
jgi:carboxymethylenebutenolidase